MKTNFSLLLGMALALGACRTLFAGGTLTPAGAVAQQIQIRDHQVNVTIDNGFAKTEVWQTFFNPNSNDLEAIYSFPLPKSASLSEVTIQTGEKTLDGEVVPKKQAEGIYENEKKAGNDAGLTTKNNFMSYEFRVAPVRANSEVRLRFVYYQPLEIELGVGRYVYPLEEGGTDESAKSFWTTRSQVEGSVSIQVELKSAWPVTDVRVPHFERATSTQKLAEDHYKVTLERIAAKLDQDFVLYYRLADNLPGRVEVIPYRATKDKPGTFMMVVTPGIDLHAITGGADYTYVLDVSGSMQGKIHTLAAGVSQALGMMRAEDRFRVITFNNQGRQILGWTAATPENVLNAVNIIKSLQVTGGTNIYAGLQLGLKDLDADRASSLVLVTDGVTNEGIADPAEFHRLLKQYDIRFFGFLMGNSSNWPLMRVMADATGGYYAAVSNADDIVGQLIMAKSKIAFEALHDASFNFSGTRVFDTTGDLPKKIFRGQQLVIFGRYESAGRATVTLNAKLTGEDKTYTTSFDFPEIDVSNPEIERLWAMAQIEQTELEANAGMLPRSESDDAIRHFGVTYQLVTDQTSMIVLDDAAFVRNGIARNNQQRATLEFRAQNARASQPPAPHRVDSAQPAFTHPAPHVSHSSGGGGALDASTATLMIFVFLITGSVWARRALLQGRSK